ncbi:MAG: gamma-glutamyl-gamma-aminobutyrate hydrolase family protein [Amphiplicatus sp.]
MQIAILETGEPPAPLANRFGAYPAMMETMLAPLAPDLSFTAVRVFDEGAPPPVGSVDGALIAGSPAGVYEQHAFIAPLEDFVRRMAGSGKPVVGICFGHQLMAQAFGGRVEKSAKGWGVGLQDYRVVGNGAWMTPRAARVACAASHQDQVVEAPKGAARLLESDFCPYAGLAYAEGSAISFQAHPEFDHDFAAALLRQREERLPGALFGKALASLAKPSDRAVIARWIANFFLQPAGMMTSEAQKWGKGAAAETAGE